MPVLSERRAPSSTKMKAALACALFLGLPLAALGAYFCSPRAEVIRMGRYTACNGAGFEQLIADGELFRGRRLVYVQDVHHLGPAWLLEYNR